MSRPATPLPVRFWAKVDKADGADCCWWWRGARNEDGYGRVRDAAGAVRPAHVVAWELVNGPMPANRMGCHACGRGADGCVRPDHVYPGTAKDNCGAGRPALWFR